MTESKERTRIRFDEVAKLATANESVSDDADERENSGMIDLAAIAGRPVAPKTRPDTSDSVDADAATVPLTFPPAPPRPTERGQRLADPVDASSPRIATPPPSSRPPPVAPPPPRPIPLDPISGLTARFPSASVLLREGGYLPLSSPLSPPPPAPSVPSAPQEATDASLARPKLPSAPTPFPLETTRPTEMPALPAKRGGGVVWLALAAGMGLGGLVAAAFFQVRLARPAAQAARIDVAPAMIPAAAPSPTAVQPPADDHPATAHDAPEARSFEPSALPAGAASTRPAEPHAAARAPSAPAATHAQAAAPPSTAAATATQTAQPAATDTTPIPAAEPAPATAGATGGPSKDASEQSLEALMRKAVGPAAPRAAAPAAPAAAAAPSGDGAKPPAGNVPLKPAMGAVQGAVGAVLPATRYCLGPDDPVSRATITFKSDGSVQSVVVTGDAAGQPAEACIRSRLMNARVPPFSNPSFTWTVTVRPAS
ncbi:MAG TPA: hypothetical protein VE987_18965 [Polyangiaceae bacterium]|nr:hypothetical protein [Polyangiaceae bacterium]